MQQTQVNEMYTLADMVRQVGTVRRVIDSHLWIVDKSVKSSRASEPCSVSEVVLDYEKQMANPGLFEQALALLKETSGKRTSFGAPVYIRIIE
jgi:hypothetical protein